MESPTKTKIPQFSRSKRAGGLNKNSSNKLSKNTLNKSDRYLLIGGEPQLRGQGQWNLTLDNPNTLFKPQTTKSSTTKSSKKKNFRNQTTELRESRKKLKNMRSSGALSKISKKHSQKKKDFKKVKVQRVMTEMPSSSHYLDNISSDDETQYGKKKPRKKDQQEKETDSNSFNFSENSFDQIKHFSQVRKGPVKMKKNQLIKLFSSIMPQAKELIANLKQLKVDLIQINNNIQKFLDKMDGKLSQTYTCKRCFKKFKTSENTQVRIYLF